MLLAYDYSRGYASPYSAEQVARSDTPIVDVHNALGLPLHVRLPIRADLWIGDHLGMGAMPTTWVQEHLHPGTAIPWYGVLISLVYSSHFLVMPTVAIVLWMRNRRALPGLDADGRRARGRRRRDVLPLPDGTALAAPTTRGVFPGPPVGATPPRAST